MDNSVYLKIKPMSYEGNRMLVPANTQVLSGQSHVRIECSYRDIICKYHGILK